MLDLVNAEDMKGYRIEMGRDVVPIEIRSDLVHIDRWLGRYRNIKIASNSDFVNSADNLKTVKGFMHRIEGYENKMLEPIEDLLTRIDGEFRPIMQNCNYTEICIKRSMLDWKTEVKRQRDEEKADKLIKAKEEEIRIKKDLETKVLEEKRKAGILEAQRKIDIEKRKELEKNKIEENRKVLQAVKHIEKAKEKISKDPSNAEEIGKEIGILERQKNIAEETIKNIDTHVSDVKNQIRLISDEEFATKRNAQKFAVEMEALVVAPEPPLTEKVPKVSGVTFAKQLRHRLIDLSIVPKEWTKVVIALDDNKIKEAIKLKGKNLVVPGIEIYEEEIVRSSSH